MVVVELPEVFKAFSLDRVQQRLVKQIIVLQQRLSSKSLTILVAGGGLQDLRPGQGSASSSHSPS